MAITINIPGALRNFAGNQAKAAFEGETVGALLDQLVAEHTSLKKHLFQQDGTLRSFVNIFVNDEDIRYLNRMDTSVQQGDEIYIIPSIAGGFQ